MQHRHASLPCIQYALNEEEALELLLTCHHKAEGLNSFCRIVGALKLEAYYKAIAQPGLLMDGTRETSSNLTDLERKDVRAKIARTADASTGNVTKVKQLLQTVIPEVKDSLRAGKVRIHRAWRWRNLSARQQHQALWEHLNRKRTGQVVRRLIAKHIGKRQVGPMLDQVRCLFGELATAETVVAITDAPGNAIVITREYCESLLRRNRQ